MKINSQSPFNLDDDSAYHEWRSLKLANAKTRNNLSVIKIKKTPPHFYEVSTAADIESKIVSKDNFPTNEILDECKNNNYCIYQLEAPENLTSEETKRLIHQLANTCGIKQLDNNICADEDSLTSIFNKPKKNEREYIPYTNKKLSWHTDGYYNPPNQTIYSMLLHCYQEAENGGENYFIDHELIYILLRDENPNWIKALSAPQTMTIPANILNCKEIRKVQSGPVFSVSPQGHLHMRYSARTKNIEWQQDQQTQNAIAYLNDLLDINALKDHSDFLVKYKLKAGEGIITRNILHCRNAFEDNSSKNKQRLFFRGRFYDELPESTKELY